MFDSIPAPPASAPAIRTRTRRGEVLAKNPEYKRFYASLTAPQRNALNTRRLDYINRLKMAPEQAMLEAMRRHPSYAAFRNREEEEL